MAWITEPAQFWKSREMERLKTPSPVALEPPLPWHVAGGEGCQWGAGILSHSGLFDGGWQLAPPFSPPQRF